MPGPAWTAAEPDYFTLRREVGRLLGRARRRPLWVLGLAVLLTGAATFKAYRRPAKYRAWAAVRFTEVVDPRLPRSRWSERELQGFINEVALPSKVLLEIYNQHVWDQVTPVAPTRAIERLRDAMSITVVKNPSVAMMHTGSTPNSAHILIGYPADTPEQARATVKALIAPIVETSTKRRKEEAALAVRRAQLELDEARQRVEALTRQAQRELETYVGPLPTAPGASPVAMMGLRDALAAARRRVSQKEEDRRTAEKRSYAESRRPGIDLQVAGEWMEIPTPRSQVLPWVASLTFLLGLPLCALLVGAFDPFVHGREDVRRLGVAVLGHLRSPPSRRRSRGDAEAGIVN